MVTTVLVFPDLDDKKRNFDLSVCLLIIDVPFALAQIDAALDFCLPILCHRPILFTSQKFKL
jgi:hypothetical protein